MMTLFRTYARKLAATILFFTALGLLHQGVVSAQSLDWPKKPVKLIVAFAPGGAVDTIGRDIAKELSVLWGQPVLIDNKPGAGGVIADLPGFSEPFIPVRRPGWGLNDIAV